MQEKPSDTQLSKDLKRIHPGESIESNLVQCPNGLVWRWGHPESSFMGVAPSTFHLLPLITTHPEGIFWSLQLQVTPY